MKIETKASVGETIYYLCDNRLHSAPVQTITVNVSKKDILSKEIEVDIRYHTCHGQYQESKVFLTKRQLAEDLCK